VKLLWVKSGGFLPLHEGGKIRSFSLARELSLRHDLSIFTFYPAMSPDPHVTLQDHFAEVECLPIDIPERGTLDDVLAYAANSLTMRPYQVVKYCRPEVARRLKDKLARGRYDALVCDYVLTAAVIPWELRIPTVIFTHNVETTIWKRHAQLNEDLMWKVVSIREHRAMARFERRFAALADHVLTVSDTDRAEFLKFLPAAKVSTIPTGVDSDYFRPQNVSNGHSLIFVGSMDWKPNEDAVLFFIDQIFPLIRKALPDVALRIVGKNPTAKILALTEKDPGIRVTGTVEDIRPYVQESSVYVVPLRIGSGTRIKIFEAMAMGIPIVSTNIGAEGLPVQHGRNIFLSDDPGEFAEHTIELLRNSVLRQRIGREGRSLVESRYSWGAAADVLAGILTQVVQPERLLEVNT